MKPAARNRDPATYITSPRSAGFAAIEISNSASNRCLVTAAVRNFSGYSFIRCPEFANRICRIEERATDVNLARIDLNMKSQRMSKLIDAARTPGDAIFDRLAHRANFTIKKIDMIAANLQPSSAVYTRSPIAERSYQVVTMTIVQFLRSGSQSGNRERMLVVVINSEIDIRMFVGSPARA